MNPIQVRRIGLGLAVTTLLFGGLLACAADPSAQQLSQSAAPRVVAAVRLIVPQGTQVHVTLSTAVGSETSQVGDSLTATTIVPIMIGDRIAIPAGSIIRGRVTEVVPGTKGLHISEKGGSVVLSFDNVTTPRGNSEAMSASLTSMASSTGKTAGIIGGSAAGGALLGQILGHNTKSTAIGAVVGGGIGTGIAAGTKGKAVKIPAGTDLTLTLDRPLNIADRA
jgi:hypothetical protein